MSVPASSDQWILRPLPGRLNSHQEIKVIPDLPYKGSLSSPWPKTAAELPLQRDATLKPFYLPSLEKHPLPFVLEISSLFGWCLGVWQWFSLAWCSILLEGGRWFRGFTVTLTDPEHLAPPLFFFLFFFFIHTWLHISHIHRLSKHHTHRVKLTFPQGGCNSWLLVYI